MNNHPQKDRVVNDPTQASPWHFEGMTLVKKPKPIPCPVCGKKIKWGKTLDGGHYITESHYVFEFLPSLYSHSFILKVPMYKCE